MIRKTIYEVSDDYDVIIVEKLISVTLFLSPKYIFNLGLDLVMNHQRVKLHFKSKI